MSHRLSVIYIKAERKWFAISGDSSVGFPSGADGKASAYLMAIYMYDKILGTLIMEMLRKYPKLKKRAYKAGILVVDKKIRESETIGVLAEVESAAAPGVYYHVKEEDGLTCSCRDFTGGQAPRLRNGQTVCKHMLAVLLNRELKRPLEAVSVRQKIKA